MRRRSFGIALSLLAAASPAAGQWTPVVEAPASDIFSVWANGDTIAAGADATVSVSTNAGTTWKVSAQVAAGVTMIRAVRVHNGRLFAGTFGQGVFVSDDLGDTWLAFNQGLVGGIFNSQLFIEDILVHGGSIYVATSGAGVWVRNLLGGTWSHFGDAFEANEASNMNDIAAGGTRLFASSGFNGTVFFRDPGDADWTFSLLSNSGLAPGLAALAAAWTGTGWVVGANIGVYRSALGQEPWTFVDLQLGIVLVASFATRGGELFALFVAGGQSVLERSHDDGATWQVLDRQPEFVYEMAMSSTDFYAGRVNGLWRRATPTAVDAGDPHAAGVPPPETTLHQNVPNPFNPVTQIRFDLSRDGPVSLRIYDVAGRKVRTLVDKEMLAGRNYEVAWNGLDETGVRVSTGIYFYRLVAGRVSQSRKMIVME